MENFSILYKLVRSIYPPRAKWSTAEIPDLSGKVALVTGGNAGIGKVVCRELVAHHAKVYILCRSPSKGEEAAADIALSTGVKGAVVVIKCDLADLASVRQAAGEFLAKEPRLDLLFANAGVMSSPVHLLTAQNYDLQFGTNVLGHALLTSLLLPLLLSTARSAPPGSVRIITTASSANYAAPSSGIIYETLKPGPVRDKNATPTLLYYQSKWANVVYSNELARRYGGGAQGLVSVSVDPGYVRTNLWHEQGKFAAWLTGFILSDTEHGALTSLYAGTSPVAGTRNGAFFVPWAREGRARSDAYDVARGERLWEWVRGELGLGAEVN